MNRETVQYKKKKQLPAPGLSGAGKQYKFKSLVKKPWKFESEWDDESTHNVYTYTRGGLIDVVEGKWKDIKKDRKSIWSPSKPFGKYKNEKDALVAWESFVKKENPRKDKKAYYYLVNTQTGERKEMKL